MKLKILTLTWDSFYLLKVLQPGLQNNLSKFDYTWYLRDNGSKDETVKETKAWKNTQILEAGHNRASFAEGVNSLFDMANPDDDDFLLLVNTDLEFHDDQAITQMVNLMDKTGAAIVGARLMFPNSNKLSHCGVVISADHANNPWHLKVNQECTEVEKKNRYFQSMTAALMLVKASNFRKAGKFDTHYRWAFEDSHLGYTVSQIQKEKVVYCGETNVSHGTSVSLKKNPVHLLNMQENVRYFKQCWGNKLVADEEFYLKDPNYLLV